MRTKRNVQQLISVGMAMLMAHPALMAGPRRPAPARPVSVGSRPVAPAAAAAATPAPAAVRKPVAAQVVAALHALRSTHSRSRSS